MFLNTSWRVKIPASGFMRYIPIILILLAGLSVSAWVVLSSKSGNTPSNMMGKQGALADYAPLIQYGAVFVLGALFWLFWRHKKGNLSIQDGRLVLKKKFGNRSLPLERVKPSCSRLFGRRGAERPLGAVCHLTGDPAEKGFRVFGYGAGCPEGLPGSPDLYGKEYDLIIMDPADFQDFVSTIADCRNR